MIELDQSGVPRSTQLRLCGIWCVREYVRGKLVVLVGPAPRARPVSWVPHTRTRTQLAHARTHRYVLQKEAAKMAMVSGMSFGQAIRIHFSGSNPDQVPMVGYGAVVGVFIGNTAYEANCFAGAMAAL